MARVQVPPSNVPLMARDGSVNQAWRAFFEAVEDALGGYNSAGAQPRSAVLDGVAELNGSPGLLVQLDADDFTKRTLTATLGHLVVTNGGGTAGNPNVALAPIEGVAGVHASPTSITVDGFGRITAIAP